MSAGNRIWTINLGIIARLKRFLIDGNELSVLRDALQQLPTIALKQAHRDARCAVGAREPKFFCHGFDALQESRADALAPVFRRNQTRPSPGPKVGPAGDSLSFQRRYAADLVVTECHQSDGQRMTV